MTMPLLYYFLKKNNYKKKITDNNSYTFVKDEIFTASTTIHIFISTLIKIRCTDNHL